jgi:hypothetical protein
MLTLVSDTRFEGLDETGSPEHWRLDVDCTVEDEAEETQIKPNLNVVGWGFR